MGYYAEQGLKVKFVRFDSAAKMIPSLGSGDVDVGSGATSAGLYNAVKRGIGIKIVSDKARNAKGYGFQAIMVRTDLIDRRQGQEPEGLQRPQSGDVGQRQQRERVHELRADAERPDL